jgi:hypothetical protein
MSTPILLTGLGKFNKSIVSHTVLTVPGTLLNKNDKMAYFLTSPSIAL